jgi:hypothetical protein
MEEVKIQPTGGSTAYSYRHGMSGQPANVVVCCNSNYYVLYFYATCFLKFIVHETNYEIVESAMVKLTGREKIDVAMGWML